MIRVVDEEDREAGLDHDLGRERTGVAVHRAAVAFGVSRVVGRRRTHEETHRGTSLRDGASAEQRTEREAKAPRVARLGEGSRHVADVALETSRGLSSVPATTPDPACRERHDHGEAGYGDPALNRPAHPPWSPVRRIHRSVKEF